MTDQQGADVLSDLARAHAAVAELIDGIADAQWDEPTPCSEWDVRQLVDHLITGNRAWASRLHDPGEGPGPTPDAAEPAAGVAYRAATAQLRAALAAPGALERVYPSPLGDLPGTGIAWLRITEELVHGWDLARATGRPTSVLPADLAAAALSVNRERMGDGPRSGTPIGTPQPVAADAPAVDRLAAFFGRTP